MPLLALGFVGLLVGIGAGLARLGWSVPAAAAAVAALHGPLMICGFFGVVIALERAVAISRYWAYLGPLLGGVGCVAAVSRCGAIAAWFFVAGSLVLVAASVAIFRRQTALFTFTLALGAVCWLVGNSLWAAGSTVHDVVTWWFAFLILTIAGERLELSRFLAPSRGQSGHSRRSWSLSVRAFAVPRTLGRPSFRNRPPGACGMAPGQDIARRMVRNRGLTRFIAVCMLSGYVWLAVGGGIILASGGLLPGAPSHDAALHALGLGFVFSMVFGHAPIIFPAVLRMDVPYHPMFYGPLSLLHISLVARVAGDASGQFALTR